MKHFTSRNKNIYNIKDETKEKKNYFKCYTNLQEGRKLISRKCE